MQLVVVITIQVISFLKKKTNVKDDEKLQCRLDHAFNFFYFIIWLNLIFRTSIICYMNIKFSQSQWLASKKFNVIFNGEQLIEYQRAQINYSRDSTESSERSRFERKQKLYESYADQQLARIITALIKEEASEHDDIIEVPENDVRHTSRLMEEFTPSVNSENQQLNEVLAKERSIIQNYD